MTTTCLACTPPTVWQTEAAYKDHLLTAHGATTTQQAMANEVARKKNLPNNTPEVGIKVGPGIDPSPDFVESLKRIEQTPTIPTVPPPPFVVVPSVFPVSEIKLEYLYKGSCPDCRTPVTTIMVEAKGELVATCYCISCRKTLKQLTVSPILDITKTNGNHGPQTRIPRHETVRSPRVQEGDKNSVPGNLGGSTSVGVQRTPRRNSKTKVRRKTKAEHTTRSTLQTEPGK